MIQDLDKKLGASDDYSFASYEDELYTKVIPLIHNTFDGLDDDSASVLQVCFFNFPGVHTHGNFDFMLIYIYMSLF